MATSVVNPRVQFFANNGRPLIGGRIHTYVAGSSTRARTYKDAAKVQPNTNPIILDGRGEAQIYLAEGVEYKFVVEDSKGALIYTQEPVYGAVWPNAEQWPSDATLAFKYMNEAKAAAEAIGPLKFYDTLAQAQGDLANLSEWDLVEISQDEEYDGARTRRKFLAGAIVFLVNLDQLRIDVTRPTGTEASGGFSGYSALKEYTGLATRSKLIDVGPVSQQFIGGDIFVDNTAPQEYLENGITDWRDASGRLWRRANYTKILSSWLPEASGEDPEKAGIALQKLMDLAIEQKKELHLTHSEYNLAGTRLKINGPLVMRGNGAEHTKLYFDAVGTGAALSSSSTTPIARFILEGFTLYGSMGDVTGLSLGTNINLYCVDFAVRNVRVMNFGRGLFTTYVWDFVFDNVRIQSNTIAATFASQTNNGVFNNVALVSFVNSISFTNCEGLVFNALDCSNHSGAGAVMLIYQSNVVINNLYLESTSAYVAMVGNVSEEYRSSLIINGGIIGGQSRVSYFNNYGVLQVKGARVYGGALQVRQYTLESYWIPGIVEFSNSNDTPCEKVYELTTQNIIGIAGAWGGVAPSIVLNRDYQEWTSTAGNGIAIAGLEIGKQYTLELILRNPNGVPISIRHTKSLPVLGISSTQFSPKLYHFTATETALRIEWAGTIHMQAIRMHEGVVHKSEGIDKNPNIWRNNSVPTGTGWKVGDRVTKTAPTAGQPKGWLYTGSAWVSEGNL